MSGAQDGGTPEGGPSQLHAVSPAEQSTPEPTSSSSDVDWETASEDDQEQEKAAALEGSSRQATNSFSVHGQTIYS